MTCRSRTRFTSLGFNPRKRNDVKHSHPGKIISHCFVSVNLLTLSELWGSWECFLYCLCSLLSIKNIVSLLW